VRAALRPEPHGYSVRAARAFRKETATVRAGAASRVRHHVGALTTWSDAPRGRPIGPARSAAFSLQLKKGPAAAARPSLFLPAVGGLRIAETEQRSQLEADPRAAERGHAPQPAVHVPGGDAAQVSADVAATGQPGADSHQDATQHRGQGGLPRNLGAELPRARG